MDPAPISAASDAGFIPVIAPIGVDAHGVTYNVNADDAAGAIARALSAEKLILLTDVEGVNDASGRLIGQLTEPDVKKLIDEGTIQGGMIPKVECCLEALRGGVTRATSWTAACSTRSCSRSSRTAASAPLLTLRHGQEAPRGKAPARGR